MASREYKEKQVKISQLVCKLIKNLTDFEVSALAKARGRQFVLFHLNYEENTRNIGLNFVFFARNRMKIFA